MGLPIWLAILISMAVTTLFGVLNGLIVVRTGLPSFIVTLATMFIVAGLSSVLDLGVTNITFISDRPAPDRRRPDRALFSWKLSFKFDQVTADLSVTIVLVDRDRPARGLRPWPAPVRKLDHRRRRLAGRGPQPRRAGRTG